jgi:membrane fusion protein, multidrug efflux system
MVDPRVWIAAAPRGVLAAWAAAGLLALLVPSVVAVRHLGRFESTDNAYVDGTLVQLSAEVRGHVIAVEVRENQRVRKGDPLVRLDDREFVARVERARAELASARAALAVAQAGVDGAQSERSAAQAERDEAEREVARLSALAARGAAASAAVQTAVARRDGARARVAMVEQRVVAERAVLESRAPEKHAEAALREAELWLASTVVYAPFDGTVGRVKVGAGENVAVGEPLLALASDEPSWIVANFKETQISEMQVGAPAVIEIDAFPDHHWIGRVTSLSPATGAQYALLPPDNATGNFTKVVQRVPVTIELVRREPPAPQADAASALRLPVGLSAEARVRVGR